MQPRPRRWLRVVVGLVVVGMLTFIAGYYVPLFRAHSALRDEFQELSERRRSLEENLAQERRDNERLNKDKDALQARLDERVQAEGKRKQQLEELRNKISSKLRDLETKGLAGSAVVGDELQIAVSNRQVFSPHTVDIPSKAADTLCDVVRAAKGFEVSVVAVTNGKESPSGRLSAKYPTTTELNAIRAAVVSNRIQEACPLANGAPRSAGWLDDEQKLFGVKLPAVVFHVQPVAEASAD